MGKVRIKGVTLIAADTYNYGGAVASLKRSMAQCEFERVVFFTNIPLKLDDIEVIQIEDLAGKDGYSEFLLKEAYKYITTDFILVTQHDSWILDSEQFDERLYEVDYAGALWLEQDGLSNGNGGFSWRSKKLMDIVAKDKLINATSPEDVALCRVYRRYLEKNYNLIWASDEICEQFSFELRSPTKPTFGFHSFFHPPYQPTIIIIRKGALGDVIQVEKLMQYFYDTGYRVVLDTLPHFHLLFINHYFKIHKLSDVDQRILKTAKVVNLDMSYESIPKQLHLKTYFEYAGVAEKDYLPYLKPPKLQIGFSLIPENKLFKKYVVLHIDKREQPGRNIYGIDWEEIVSYLNDFGYMTVIIGRGEHEQVEGAIELNCTNEHFLSYVVGGAEMMIGIDSGISHIASAFDVPSIVFFGNVNPAFIHPDLSNIQVITNHSVSKPICENVYCWHSVIGCEGTPCYIDKDTPPCSIYSYIQVIDAIDKIIQNKNANNN